MQADRREHVRRDRRDIEREREQVVHGTAVEQHLEPELAVAQAQSLEAAEPRALRVSAEVERPAFAERRRALGERRPQRLRLQAQAPGLRIADEREPARG